MSLRGRRGTARVADGRYELRTEEVDQVGHVVTRLRGRVSTVDAPEAVDESRLLNGLLPEGLLRALEDFRRFGNDQGTLTVRGLPVPSDLPDTPCVPNSVARECTPSAALLLLLMSRLGDPIAYREEKHGALIQDICPVPGEEDQQQNTGSVYFELHTENAFHANRPDFLGLLCLRPDHDRQAASITSSITEALLHLAPEHVEVLRRPRFRTRLAPSFCRGQESRPYVEAAPVLAGTPELPLLSVDFDDTLPLDADAREALDALHLALRKVQRESVLYAGDLVIIDNSTTVHGRSLFVPRYDGRDRWLQRLFVVNTLRTVLPALEQDGTYRCRPLAVPA
ncbi:TauD/TfdA family dioxygenase [Micromonospora sp. NPDC049559]|uniref:TauD/TfdA family dioxygenase n=1 Tax=Micromonospora sp. NPDC049559 TaxID=3155923 RepID=UPI003446E7CB